MSSVSIPTAEYAARVAAAQALLRKTDLDVLLVNSNEADFANVRYFSDYWPIFEMAGVVMPRQGEPTLLIGPESETYAQGRSRIPRIRKMVEYRETADPAYPGVEVADFRRVFEEVGAPEPKKIGIAGYLVTTLPILDGLRAAFPGASLVRADEIMVALRSVKSPAEIACLKEAFRISELAVDALLEQIRPGMTELQAVGIAQAVFYANGAEGEGMPQYVLSGKKSNQAISRPTHKVMERGELVQLNISARVDGYSSGVGRPICLGKMTPKMRDLVEFGKLAHEQTMSWMRAGVIASDVAKRYQQLFVEHGYGHNFLYGPCHGLGMIEVEPPWMEVISDYPLAENMTFQIDTFVQDVDFGLRWENGVRVTATGVEMFSNRNMAILELG
ncbi:MAG: aminopeptidase P family protein [Anaerolineae bacterium]|nr:aminopeptidase P family protein [Anaerolineae bacterium]